ncbi:MAG TPA: response regulator [Anaeromyxobacteraceae bacterium]|nr:response regulator [Anaeromyxobacteraceae bacterium]
MEPSSSLAAFAAVFDRASGARLEQAERFVLALPSLFPGALVGCDVGWRAPSSVLALVVRFAERRFDEDARRRLDFWCARAGVRATPLAPLPEAQRAAFLASFARCEPRVEGAAPEELLAATARLFEAAGAAAGRARAVPERPELLVDVGGPGWTGVHFEPGERTLFLPGVLAPPAGDELVLALRFPGVDHPLRSRARVAGVRPADRARAGGGTAGFSLALEEPPPELCEALEEAMAGAAAPHAGGTEQRRHPRYAVKAPVVVTPRADADAGGPAPAAAAGGAPSVDGPGAGERHARIEYASDEELAVDYVDNLSQGGAFVRTGHPAPVGTRLTLSMRLPAGEELTAPAVVVVANDKGMGVRFELSEEGEQRLAAAIAHISARPRRALVVDDERLVRAVLAEALRERGFEVLTAEHGAAGLSVVADELLALDLLITDLKMPQMDGEAFLRTIRSAGGESELAIVVVTGALQDGVEKRLQQEGADAVLDKALGPDLIAQAADAVLERKRQRRA